MEKRISTPEEKFKEAINKLQEAVNELNVKLGEEHKRATITFQSNPSRKIEDCSIVKSIEAGINDII